MREEGAPWTARTGESRRTTTDGKVDAKTAPLRSNCIALLRIWSVRFARPARYLWWPRWDISRSGFLDR